MARSRRTMSVLALVATLLVCLGGLATVAYTAPPRGHGRLAGVFIETDAGYARIPCRALACAPVEASARRETCWTTVDGQQLRVDVAHRAPESRALHTRLGRRAASGRRVARPKDRGSCPEAAGRWSGDIGTARGVV